ncbi:manganese efflux pump [Candidatus Sumerlaeota bacterium]|nr:manganese efflux pump [Candidatus Sumerlaeota bacterium]
MKPVEIVIVALCLGMDAFCVALGVGSKGATARQTFRLSFHFGLFQFLMPLIGWSIGSSAVGVVQSYDHWVAFAILLGVGLHMIIESLREERRGFDGRDPTRGWSLVGLSLATSMDALAVGVGLGILRQRLIGSAIVIGIVAGAMTIAGLHSGQMLRLWIGRRMETIGGLALVGLAFRMLSI